MDDMTSYYYKQIEWSRKTFGPDNRTNGICEHIRKELKEIEADPFDLMEWIDIIILGMDGFWRHGGHPEQLLHYLLLKQQRNFDRQWPDWQDVGSDHAIEHKR